ncbi:MAG: hypothetical protein HN348_28790, partial [Proteobacteria bacterium]|nr:hypothetical protein [Pseudomonadota bacterium]
TLCFPADVDAAVKHSLRRPDLDARLLRLERSFPAFKDPAQGKTRPESEGPVGPPPNPYLRFIKQPAVIAGLVAAVASVFLLAVLLFGLFVWPGYDFWPDVVAEEVPPMPEEVENVSPEQIDDQLAETLAAMSAKPEGSPLYKVFSSHIAGLQDRALVDLEPAEWDRLSFATGQVLALQQNPGQQPLTTIPEAQDPCVPPVENVENTDYSALNSWFCCKKTRRQERGMDKDPSAEQEPHSCDKVPWDRVMTIFEGLNAQLGEDE